MQVLILNLEKDATRFQFIRAQLKGLDAARVDAVMGKDLPESITSLYTPESTAKPTPWTAGQLGCFLSHKKAWGLVNESATPALVLEDDLHLSPALAQFMRDTSWLPKDADVVRLETSTNSVRLGSIVGKRQGRAVRRLRSTAWCAGAYILTPAGAQKCLSAPLAHAHAADAFLFNLEQSPTARHLTLYQIAPALAVQDKYAEQKRRQGFLSNLETYAPTGPAMVERIKTLPQKAARYLRGYRYVVFGE